MREKKNKTKQKKKKKSHDEFVNLCMESFDLKLHPKRTLCIALYTYYWWIKVLCCLIFIMIKWNQIVIHWFETYTNTDTHIYHNIYIYGNSSEKKWITHNTEHFPTE